MKASGFAALAVGLALGGAGACGPAAQEFCADLGEYPERAGGARFGEIFEWQSESLNRLSTGCTVRAMTVEDELQLRCEAQDGTPVDMQVLGEGAHSTDLVVGDAVNLYVAQWQTTEGFSVEATSVVDDEGRTRFALVYMQDLVSTELMHEMLGYLEGDFQVSIEVGELCEIETGGEVVGGLTAQRFILHASNAQAEVSVVAPALDLALGDGRLDLKVGHWNPYRDSVPQPRRLWFTYRTH